MAAPVYWILKYLDRATELQRVLFSRVDILHYMDATLSVEYPIVVSDQLKGSLDDYLQNKEDFLIIEAKNEDLERGFVQFALLKRG